MLCDVVLEAADDCYVELSHLAVGLRVIGCRRKVINSHTRGHSCEELRD